MKEKNAAFRLQSYLLIAVLFACQISFSCYWLLRLELKIFVFGTFTCSSIKIKIFISKITSFVGIKKNANSGSTISVKFFKTTSPAIDYYSKNLDSKLKLRFSYNECLAKKTSCSSILKLRWTMLSLHTFTMLGRLFWKYKSNL